jgi:hypothetical protein
MRRCSLRRALRTAHLLWPLYLVHPQAPPVDTAGVTQDVARPPAVFPRGTRIPIRFLYPIVSGRDTVGTFFLVQTMGALRRDSCVVVPPYAHLAGRITLSRGGGRFGKRGEVALAFDSLKVRPGMWASVSAVLDTLEYAPRRDVSSSGVVYARPVSVGARLLPAGAAVAVDIAVVPAVMLGAYMISRPGARVRILAGEVGVVRLLNDLVVGGATCQPGTPDVLETPELPLFPPRSTNKEGVPWDPINLVFLGTGGALDTTFARAGWVRAHAHTTGSVLKEILAVVEDRRAASAPVGTEYFEGRPQDAAFELAGPNARIRHHVRLWRLDSLAGIWVGAATEDVGIILVKRTHRISPRVDRERDRIVRDLEAGGCAHLGQYVRLPGAMTRGRTTEGQSMVSDGRAAVVRLTACDSA